MNKQIVFGLLVIVAFISFTAGVGVNRLLLTTWNQETVTADFRMECSIKDPGDKPECSFYLTDHHTSTKSK